MQHTNVSFYSDMISLLEIHKSQMLSSHGVSPLKTSFLPNA